MALFVKDFSAAFTERLDDRFYRVTLEQDARQHLLLDFGRVGRNPAFPRKVYIGADIHRGLGRAGGRVFHEPCMRPVCPHELVFRDPGIPRRPGDLLNRWALPVFRGGRLNFNIKTKNALPFRNPLKLIACGKAGAGVRCRRPCRNAV